jgi:predicted HNH restriction endonuclease
MEATSIATVDEINRFLYDTIFNNLNYNIANSIYDEWFAKVQDVITIHYLAGSSYDTEFWKHAVKLAEMNWSKRSVNFATLVDSVKNNKNIGNYGTWTTESWRQNLTALGII